MAERQWWTPARVRLAALWLIATTVAGLYQLLWAMFAASTFMGVPPDAGGFAEGSRRMMLSGLILAFGPLGVWWFRRTLRWLVAAAVIFGLFELLALFTLLSGS